jgi:Zn-dependent M28 family amino/carboxypeptidase
MYRELTQIRGRISMENRRYLFLLLLLLLPFGVLTAQEEAPAKKEAGAVATITERELRAHMGFLASEELEGRGTGDHSLKVAAKYIESEFAECGIKPPPGQKSYFQEIPFTIRKLTETPQLSIKRATGSEEKLKHEKGFTVMSFSGEGEQAIEVVFAGYGITAPEKKYDDYKGVDVKGKAVLVLRYAPKYSIRDARFVDRKHAYLHTKYENAVKHGASAFLLVTGVKHSKDQSPSEERSFARGGKEQKQNKVPAFHISPQAAQKLLGDKKLKELEEEIEKNLKPASFELKDTRITASVKFESSDAGVRNVIGFIEGSDPQLKKEVVVIGAHYDHLGRYKDRIYFGADDNASGTCALIEAAEAFTLGKKKPARSILFIAFAAEEVGLVGSRYYVEHPLVPLKDTVFMVNMDMVGRAKEDSANIGGGKMTPEIEKICRECAEKAGLKTRMGEMPGGGSDQVPFFDKNIPSIFIISSSNPDYHTPRDTMDKINYPTMTRVAKMAYLITNTMANLPKRPEVDIAGLKKRAQRKRANRPYLGINFDETDKGVQISRVSENSPAQDAGLKPQDIVLSIKDTRIKSSRDLWEVIRKLKAGEEIEIEVLRGGKKQVIKLEVGRRSRR